MRKCIRCGTMMEEGFRIKAQLAGTGLDIVTEDSVFPKRIGTVRAAVCFSCGEVSLYIDLTAEEKKDMLMLRSKSLLLLEALSKQPHMIRKDNSGLF